MEASTTTSSHTGMKYNQFTGTTKSMCKAIIKTFAEKVIAMKKKTANGCLPQGFLAKLINQAKNDASNLKINQIDANNMVNKIQSQARNYNVPPDNALTEEAASEATTLVCDSSPSEEGVSSTDSSSPSIEESAGSTLGEEFNEDNPANVNEIEDSTQQRNKGGRPVGSMNAKKIKQDIARKKTINWVVTEYIELQEAAGKRVKKGTLTKLVHEAKTTFEIEGEFDVSPQLINHRKSTGNHEVWHRGTPSPLLAAEPVLVSFILTAANSNAPLSVGNCIQLMIDLAEDTGIGAKLIAWKKKHCVYDKDSPLLGRKWWEGFKKRNSELIDSKVGRKFAKNRADHANYTNHYKMYSQCYQGIVDSGNAVWLHEPVHFDKEGNQVSDEIKAFGHPTKAKIIRGKNIFVLDETGSNTHGKDDGANGGEKKVTGKGQVASQEVGVNDDHHTVLPIHNLLGVHVMNCIMIK
jgi:hypothetical protein